MAYRWATLTPYGAPILEPGYWFFEAKSSDMTPAVLKEIHSRAPFVDVYDDPSRDWFMGMVSVPGSLDIVLPTGLPSRLFQRVDDNSKTLRDIKEELYGASMLEPMGFLEWLATRHPSAMASILSTAESVQSASDSLRMNVGGALVVGAVLFVVYKLLTGPKG